VLWQAFRHRAGTPAESAALVAVVAAVAHDLFDFGLEHSGVAVPVAVLLGATLGPLDGVPVPVVAPRGMIRAPLLPPQSDEVLLLVEPTIAAALTHHHRPDVVTWDGVEELDGELRVYGLRVFGRPPQGARCASCAHAHHPYDRCHDRFGTSGYRCGCLSSEARSVPSGGWQSSLPKLPCAGGQR
jgi:hypothetical protein